MKKRLRGPTLRQDRQPKYDPKQQPKHQTVTPYPAHNRPGYCTTFKDPRNGKRLNRSLGTTDRLAAKEICLHLERIANNAEFWSLKNPLLHTLNPKAVDIFFAGEKPEPLNDQISASNGFHFISRTKSGASLDWASFGSEELRDALAPLCARKTAA